MNNIIVTYVTGNKFKVQVAKEHLEKFGIEIESQKIELPELQADTIEEVAISKAKYAANALNKPIMINDSGLIIPALNDFPGPMSKYFEQTIGEDGILKLMVDIEDRKAYFKEVISYCEPKEEPILFTSITNWSIAKEKKGEYGWGSDQIFVVENSDKTLAQFLMGKEKNVGVTQDMWNLGNFWKLDIKNHITIMSKLSNTFV